MWWNTHIGMPAPLMPVPLAVGDVIPGVEHAAQDGGWGMLMTAALMIAPPMAAIALARARKRRGLDMYIRRIPGISAIDEAVGRAVEMGRPIAFTFGLTLVGPLFFACLGVLSHIARRAARYGSRLLIPQMDVEVMTITQSAVRECFRKEGKPEAYREEDIRFMSDEQFAFASGFMGMVHRERAAACFLFGSFAAESLILAEAGQQAGAIQVAGTTSNEQVAFFITTCDYTIIGEEVYAAGAYLSGDPVQRGSLRGQDAAKMVLLALLLAGAVNSTADVRDAAGSWNSYRTAVARWLVPPSKGWGELAGGESGENGDAGDSADGGG
ncbi:MAG: hypothetical protein N3A38_04335 [Planctomycetota bacterium]|nr:hypothetical protein [Planctomycetota bacterium]